MNNQHIVFNVEDMILEKEEVTISRALNNLNGIVEVVVDSKTKHVAVEYDEERLDVETMKGTIEDLGYKVR